MMLSDLTDENKVADLIMATGGGYVKAPVKATAHKVTQHGRVVIFIKQQHFYFVLPYRSSSDEILSTVDFLNQQPCIKQVFGERRK